MLPRIADITPTQATYLAFLDALKTRGFKGDLAPDYANRVVQATDNSIYQLLPQGAVYPKDVDDLVVLAKLSAEERFQDISLSPRGGGTGTNGQSLTDGLIVDVSKHMNRILDINPADRTVRVQAGVVKDQLNAALEPYGLFFAPELSPSNRATLGGMINTDACGQGSCAYGKTRDHVLELKSVLLDGTVWESRRVDDAELDQIKQRTDRAGEIHRVVDGIFAQNAQLIEERFPKLNRCLTGYDLAHIRDGEGSFNLNSILCGAEGTLAFIAEAKLNVMRIPEHAALVNVKYASFEDTLRDAQELLQTGSTSVEAIDSTVLNLAMNDIVWDSVRDLFPANEGIAIRGINLVEYTAEDEAELKRKVKALTDKLDAVQGQPGKSFGYTVAYDEDQIKRVWGMRKKSVGLLGNVEGEARPIPFVEDTAVPPENLADFIMDFRAALDRHKLAYGMFGHVDAGVLHVRPAIDMKDPHQETYVREITDEVVALTKKYKGLLWGEHGKGVRSEYSPEFFGPLYPCLQRIKAAFDPRNQLNPGKICTAPESGATLLKIDSVPTRGQHDRQIPAPVREDYAAAMFCNGNGACFNFDPYDSMCPSWKGTRERIHSPKGRASLTREWLRLLAERGVDPVAESRRLKDASFIGSFLPRLRNTRGKQRGEYDFSHEVYGAMSGCLACKSCATQCPIRVDVADFRSQFLELYYGRYLRPAKDYVVGSLEFMLPYLAGVPAVYNWAIGNQPIRTLMRDRLGLVDHPKLSGIDLKDAVHERGIAFATPEALEALPAARRDKAVVVVQDAFTSYFETSVVLDLLDLLQRLGFVPLLAPFKANGKPLHVHGFLGTFRQTAAKNAAMLKALESRGVPLIGVDPSMTLSYRFEYAKALGKDKTPKVSLIQEWLAKQTSSLQDWKLKFKRGEYRLLAHCTEKTNAASSLRDWQSVFAAFNQSLMPLNTGCCGMAGTYGHEAGNAATSRRIYELSWSEVINDPNHPDKLVADGYSCRSQVKRMDGRSIKHPVQALLALTPAQETQARASARVEGAHARGVGVTYGISESRGCC
jgi:FAD/FMN-containing dehydrogenase/Fe-S oxidoreductase